MNKRRLLGRRRSSTVDIHPADRIFTWLVRMPSFLLFLLLVCVGFFLAKESYLAYQKFGVSFLFSKIWDPVAENFGALPFIFGTVVSSLLAVLLAAPLSIGVALYLNELAPKKIVPAVGFLVEMLAAIPSVVYGLWGIFVLAPWLRTSVEPFLGKYFGFLPFFQGPPYGVGMLAAGLILAIMITPTIAAISREVFKTIPAIQREAALSLGATRWEMIRISVLKASWPGVQGGIFLGLGRALGETMAVTMVIGNRNDISWSFFDPGQTMASLIANEYAEASSEIHLAALAYIGLSLFVVTFSINALARLLVLRMNREKKA